jgi:hypothetical protein
MINIKNLFEELGIMLSFRSFRGGLGSKEFYDIPYKKKTIQRTQTTYNNHYFLHFVWMIVHALGIDVAFEL